MLTLALNSQLESQPNMELDVRGYLLSNLCLLNAKTRTRRVKDEQKL